MSTTEAPELADDQVLVGANVFPIPPFKVGKVDHMVALIVENAEAIWPIWVEFQKWQATHTVTVTREQFDADAAIRAEAAEQGKSEQDFVDGKLSYRRAPNTEEIVAFAAPKLVKRSFKLARHAAAIIMIPEARLLKAESEGQEKNALMSEYARLGATATPAQIGQIIVKAAPLMVEVVNELIPFGLELLTRASSLASSVVDAVTAGTLQEMVTEKVAQEAAENMVALHVVSSSDSSESSS